MHTDIQRCPLFPPRWPPARLAEGGAEKARPPGTEGVAPGPGVPSLRNEAMSSCPVPKMRTCPSSLWVRCLRPPRDPVPYATWLLGHGNLGWKRPSRTSVPPSLSGGETEPQGGPAAGPGLGAGWRPVMNILADRPLASCRLTLPLGTGPRVATAGRTD